jgi:hypothetical protein
MKPTLLLLLLIVGGINLLLPEQLFFALIIMLAIVVAMTDKAKIYTSSFPILLPLIVLVVLGVVKGLIRPKYFNADIYRDIYRDFFIFFKNIIYFIAGIALSKYIKDFSGFFRYFLILAFASSLIHLGLIATHLHSISSLETIRYFAGFGNEVEGIALSLFLSRVSNKSFRTVLKNCSVIDKIMVTVIAVSFLLYFSRTLIVLVVVVSFFLTDTLYIRKVFSRQNVKIFKVFVLICALFYLISFITSLQPLDSPLRTLVSKFENIPAEVSWNKRKNRLATKEEIQNNWRGYEAYQGLLKFRKGNAVKKILGFGFGARVDLGITMKLGGKDYDTVPILHNEYVTLLVKCGVIGLLLYLFFLFRIGFSSIKNNKDKHPEIYYSFQMLSALSVVSLLNTYIGFGLLDPSNAAIPIFMGFFWGNIQRNKIKIDHIRIKTINDQNKIENRVIT